MMSKKLVLGSLGALALVALLATSSARAATHGKKLALLNRHRNDMASSTDITGTSTVRINHNKALKAKAFVAKLKGISFRGPVQSLSGSTLTVNASTTTYTIDGSKAKVIGMKGHKGSLSNIQIGDAVKVTGKVATDGTIKALLIRDTTRSF